MLMYVSAFGYRLPVPGGWKADARLVRREGKGCGGNWNAGLRVLSVMQGRLRSAPAERLKGVH
jgi:hypothetical protein